MSYFKNKKIKKFKEVVDGTYQFSISGYKIIGTVDAIKELVADGVDEANTQYMLKKENTKSDWFLQLQGSLSDDTEFRTNYNINLYPDETKDIDMLTYQLSQLAIQLDIESEDILEILEESLHKVVTLYVYTNSVMRDGVLQQYKNNSFNKPVQMDADADFE